MNTIFIPKSLVSVNIYVNFFIIRYVNLRHPAVFKPLQPPTQPFSSLHPQLYLGSELLIGSAQVDSCSSIVYI